MPPESHDTYVYGEGRRWAWKCPCGASGGPFKRRMDADESAAEHQEADRSGD